MGNINEWQHSAMYVAFLLSGVVDLVGFYMPPGTLPVGTEQVAPHTWSYTPPSCQVVMLPRAHI